jgi:nicotinamide mononucleotide transporter
LTEQLKIALTAMSLWELAAVVLGVAYLLLAMRENILCWYCAFISTLIFTFLFWDASLLMASGLQIYYLIMAVYGWHQWSNNFDKTEIPELAIIRWTAKQHFAAIGVVLSLTFTSGWLLSEYSTSALPFLESFTAWGAVITTYMVVQKVLENWLYWIVIDGTSVFLYFDKELYLTALLFTAYVVIVCFGFWEWLKHYQKNNA